MLGIVNLSEKEYSLEWRFGMAKNDNYHKIVLFLLAVCLLSMPPDVRFLNSISIALIGTIPLLHPNRALLLKRAFRNPFFLSCLSIVLLQFLGIFYAHDQAKGWSMATSGAGLISAPLLFSSGTQLSFGERRKLILLFSLSLFFVSCYCLLYALFDYYLVHHDISVFFYHKLLQPFSQHAIFFSFFLFTCVVFWLEKDISTSPENGMKLILIILTLFFLGMIFLLSSKLLIVLTLLYLVYFFLRTLLKGRTRKSASLISILLLIVLPLLTFTNNPVKARFLEITNGNLDMIRKEKFESDIYLNGVQFRLLNWRHSIEILNEQKAWLFGVSPGDAQYWLDKKFVEANIALGDGSRSRGYAGYHCHNQFLQFTLQSGIVGLLLFLTMLVSLFAACIRKKSRESFIISLGLTAFCLTDSVLLLQYGLVIFTILPLLGLYTLKPQRRFMAKINPGILIEGRKPGKN